VIENEGINNGKCFAYTFPNMIDHEPEPEPEQFYGKSTGISTTSI
jgi:hypothetical protein